MFSRDAFSAVHVGAAYAKDCEEIVQHMFVKCPFMLSTWREALLLLGYNLQCRGLF